MSKKSKKSKKTQAPAPVAQKRQYRIDPIMNRDRPPISTNVTRIPPSLPQLRALCRDLVHNNVYAKRAVSVRTQNFVGKGIRIHVSCDHKEYADAFQRWASTSACDFERQKSLYGIQDLMVRSENESGEGIVIMRDTPDENGDLWPTLQCIDTDMICESVTEPHYEGALVRFGVEYDMSGRFLGMHFKRFMDDDRAFGNSPYGLNDSYFVPEEDILHFFEQLHPGQMRGIPRSAQVLSIVDIHNGLIRAALTKAEVEMCFGLAVKKVPSDSGVGQLYDPNNDGMDVAGPMPLDYIQPGMIYYLKDGEEIQAINPSASASFEPYVRIGLEAISVGYNVTYSQISGDLSRVNYSSEKAGRSEFMRGIEAFRSIRFEPLMRKVERRFRDAYILNLEPPFRDAGFGVSSVYRDETDTFDQKVAKIEAAEVTIIPPARERIDPQKEVLVEVTELQTGALTWRQYILQQGKDPDLQMKELKKERDELAALGLNLTFGSVETALNALAASVAAQDAQDALEENATLFDRMRGGS